MKRYLRDRFVYMHKTFIDNIKYLFSMNKGRLSTLLLKTNFGLVTFGMQSQVVRSSKTSIADLTLKRLSPTVLPEMAGEFI